MAKKTLSDLGDLRGKRVLVRVDFNVPLDKKTGEVANDRRIRGALPTIQKLLDGGAAVIAMSHLGRPTGDPVKDDHLKMDRVAARLSDLLIRPVRQGADWMLSRAVGALASTLKHGEVLMLENLRFDPREKKNDPEFAAMIAALGDAYVNDAFGACHNDHDASMVAVPATMKAQGKPRAIGLLVAKELEIIDGLMNDPRRPLIGIMGGAKVSDKLTFINALLQRVDQLLVGGKMAYAFMKAQGVSVGSMSSAISTTEVAAASKLLSQVGTKITLPIDSLVCRADDLSEARFCDGPIPDGCVAVDIGPKTLAMFAERIRSAGTVIWNGPVGWFEKPDFSAGTLGIAAAMAASQAVTVVGGGETAEAVEQFGFDRDMTHVSTGGGAFLAYIEGRAFASLAQIDDK